MREDLNLKPGHLLAKAGVANTSAETICSCCADGGEIVKLGSGAFQSEKGSRMVDFDLGRNEAWYQQTECKDNTPNWTGSPNNQLMQRYHNCALSSEISAFECDYALNTFVKAAITSSTSFWDSAAESGKERVRCPAHSALG